MYVYKEKKKKHFYKNYFVILGLGAEPSQFSGQRKLLNERLPQLESQCQNHQIQMKLRICIVKLLH